MKGAYEVNPLNPYGIHYVKFFVALGLIGVHSLAWLNLFGGHQLQMHTFGMIFAGSFLCCSMLTPLTAGASQALSVQPFFLGSRLRGYKIAPVALVLGILVVIEASKGAFYFGPGVLFSWNVMHLIAASLLITLAIARFSIWAVALSSVGCILLTEPIRRFVQDFEIVDVASIADMNSAGVPLLIELSLGVGLAVVALASILFISKAESKYKVRMAAIVATLLGLFILVAQHTTSDFYFAARVLNLPVGALIGDHRGFHIWPLFPWYSVVSGGFVYFWWLANTTRPRQTRLILSAATLICIGVYYAFYLDTVLEEFDPANIWSTQVFNGHLSVLLYCFGFFSFFTLSCDALSRSPWLKRQIATWPFLLNVPLVFSRSIFFIYVMINTVGIFLAYPFAKLLSLDTAFVVFIPFMIVLNYFLGRWLIYWLAKKKLSVKFTMATHGK